MDSLTNKLADGYDCGSYDPIDKLDCLQALDAATLEVSSTWGEPTTFNVQAVHRPTGVVDGDFLPDTPTNLLRDGNYNHVDVMVGFTKDEGVLQTLQLALSEDLMGLVGFGWNTVFGPMF